MPAVALLGVIAVGLALLRAAQPSRLATSRVVYQTRDPDGASLWVVRGDGTTPARVFQTNGTLADLSESYRGLRPLPSAWATPDGATLLFLTIEGSAQTLYRARPADPGQFFGSYEVRALVRSEHSLTIWDIAPDGQQLLVAQGGARPTLDLVSLADGQTQALALPAPNGGSLGGQFAPDGRQVLAWQGEPGAARAATFDRQGGGRQELDLPGLVWAGYAPPAPGRVPALLWLQRGAEGRDVLWRGSPTQPQARAILTDQAFEQIRWASPESEPMVVLRAGSPSSRGQTVYLWDARGDQLTPVGNSPGRADFILAPSGDHGLLRQSGGSQGPDLFSFTDGRGQRPRTVMGDATGQQAGALYRFAPDSHNVLLTLYQAAVNPPRWQLYLLDTATGTPTLLAESPNTIRFAYSPDGRRLVFDQGSPDGQSVALVTIDLAELGTPPARLAEGYNPSWLG